MTKEEVDIAIYSIARSGFALDAIKTLTTYLGRDLSDMTYKYLDATARLKAINAINHGKERDIDTLSTLEDDK